MIRIRSLIQTACILGLLCACLKSNTKPEQTQNQLTAQEQADGWVLLFNGKTLEGWKRYNHDSIGPIWTVKNGMIACNPKAVADTSADFRGSLITTRQFANFDLRFAWKISRGGNSGVMYHVIENASHKNDYETGPEFQILDDSGWTGEELKPAQLAAANYDMHAPAQSKILHPAGEWNEGRIVYNNGHVEHWLNGEKVISFDENSDDYNDRLRKSKWVDYPNWNKLKTGALSLQDHSDEVYFRNIRIKALRDQ